MIILGIDPGSRNCGYGIINVVQRKASLLDAGIINISLLFTAFINSE